MLPQPEQSASNPMCPHWDNLLHWRPHFEDCGPLHVPSSTTDGLSSTGHLGRVYFYFFHHQLQARSSLHSPCQWSKQTVCWVSWSVPSPDSVFHVPEGQPQHRGASGASHRCRCPGFLPPCDRGNPSRCWIPWDHKGRLFLRRYRSQQPLRSRNLQNTHCHRPHSHRKFFCSHPGCRRCGCCRLRPRTGQAGMQQHSSDHRSPTLSWSLAVPAWTSLSVPVCSSWVRADHGSRGEALLQERNRDPAGVTPRCHSLYTFGKLVLDRIRTLI